MDFTLIKNGDTASVDFSFSNPSGNDAKTVTVEFTIPTGFTYVSSVLSYGTIADHPSDATKKIWTVGIFPKQTTISATLVLQASIDCPELPACVIGEIISDCDSDSTNNIAEKKIDGITCCSLTDCANLTSEEKIYELATTDFADPLNPTVAEVKTWADANIELKEQEGGTVIAYIDKPFAEFNVYNNFNANVNTVGVPGSLLRFKINGDFPDDPVTSFDSSDSASFDEAAVKSYLESFITGTVTVTDNVDATGDVDIAVTSQTGVTDFQIIDENDNEFDTDVETFVVQNNYGRTTYSHVWVANKTDSGYQITRIYQVEDHGNVNYVSKTGVNAVAETGDSHNPFTVFGDAFNISSGGVIEILPGSFSVDSEIIAPKVGEEISVYAKPGTHITSTVSANNLFTTSAAGNSVTGKLTFLSDGTIENSGVGSRAFIFGQQRLNEYDIQLNKVILDSGYLAYLLCSDLDMSVKDLESTSTNPYVVRLTIGDTVESASKGNLKFGDLSFTADDNTFLLNSYSLAGKGSQNKLSFENVFIDGTDGVLIFNSVPSFKSNFSIKVENLFATNTLTTDSPDFYSTANKNISLVYSSGELEAGAFGSIQIGSAETENVPLVHLANDLTNSSAYIKIDQAIVGDYGVILSGDLVNSTVIIDANITGTGDKPTVTLIGTADATSKVIIRGRHEATGAIPAIAVGESYVGRVIIEEATLINDGTVATVQTDAVAPIGVVFARSIWNTILANEDANINKLGEAPISTTDLI